MEKQIHFIKMEGAGNDYVYVDCFSQFIKNPQALARQVSRRHFGIGSDGLILIKPSPRADCFMDIYNADGSRGRTCGNGLRCTARLLWKKSGGTKNEFSIETLSGISCVQVSQVNRRRSWVQAGMGQVFVRNIPAPVNRILKMLPGGVFTEWVHVADAGNLHCIVKLKTCHEEWSPVQVLEQLDLKAVGSFLEHYEGFPGSVNVEFCVDESREGCLCSWEDSGWECPDSGPSVPDVSRKVRARVWERGSGETLACGSGACAIYQAFYKAEGPADCCIFMPGGRLYVTGNDHEVLLGGMAADVFEGDLPVSL